MEEQEEESLAQKGFNAGYLIQKHEPELLKQIINESNEENRLVSFISAGSKEFKKELLVNKQREMQQRQQSKTPKR